MQPSCPHCDQPDLSLLRLGLIGELLKADATWLLCLADVMQQCGLLPLAAEAEASEAPVVRPRTATLHTLHMDVMTSPSAHAVLASCHALAQALALTLEDVSAVIQNAAARSGDPVSSCGSSAPRCWGMPRARPRRPLRAGFAQPWKPTSVRTAEASLEGASLGRTAPRTLRVV